MRAQERLQLYAIQCLLRVIFLNGQHPTAKTFTGCRCRLYLLWVKVWVVAETSTYLFHYWHWYVILQQNHCTNFIRKIHNQVFKWRTPIINGYVLPVVMKSLFHGTGSVPMDVRYLPLLPRLSGTHYPRTRGIRRFLRTVTDSLWRRFNLRCTSGAAH